MTEDGETWDTSADVEARVEGLLAQFTPEQKVDLVTGLVVVVHDRRSDPPPPSPVPPFSITDGPNGVRVADRTMHGGTATALPAAIALAATWSPELAGEYGDLLGAETAAHGHNVLLGPGVDIARAPWAGRTFESFGEDPLLQARLVVPEIEAIQRHRVQACLKHYIVNNQEYQRNFIDVRVDERALQEIYLPPFRAAVQAGHVASVMGSYNKINGTYACENPYTLTTVLREQLGFRGWVMSDFMGNHSTVESARAGLDWELTMQPLWGPYLLAAVQEGAVSGATLDEMVRRILRPTVGLGCLDGPRQVGPVPTEQHGTRARAIAEAGVVLLKNAGDVLPLGPDGLRTIAVLGPDADNVAAAGGGSGLVQPSSGVSVLDGMRARAGEGVEVAYGPGTDPIGVGVLLPGPPAVPSTVLRPADSAVDADEVGLRAEYWANPDFAGEPSVIRTDLRAEIYRGFAALPGLDASSPKLAPFPRDLPARFSVRWTGSFTPPATGDYTLSLTSFGSARLALDGEVLIDATSGPAPTPEHAQPGPAPVGTAISAVGVATATIPLVAGTSYGVTIMYAADAPGQSFFQEAMVRFGWEPPADAVTPAIAAAVDLAARSDVAVVVARTFEMEETDRPDLRLPNEQDVLIRAVAAANPRTVVVLMSGGPVEIANWEAGVPAILEAWFAGQEQGNAVARVLFGDVNPAGRLPLTFPRSEDQTPVATPEQYPGVDGALHYREGIFVGYRGYEQQGIEPQYPFGFGLSYTDFAYANLRLSSDVLHAGGTITVAFDVTNTGERAGDEVVQLYVTHLDSRLARPRQELKAFQRLLLQPGQTETASLTVAADDLAYWDTTEGRFVVEKDTVEIRVGRSSADIQLRTTVTVVA
jgi:beta-glucosidase